MESSITLTLFILLFLLPNSTSFPPEAHPTKSGYLLVDPPSTSAIFYAFYEAQTPNFPIPQTPIIIWLQGGPGCSSMFGNFFELGPWRVSTCSHAGKFKHQALQPNPGSWNHLFGLLFLDNPIGTGFSISASPHKIPRDQKTVARHLFQAIARFTSSTGFTSRPIYITGESYAGKYVPAIGYYILKKNKILPEGERVNLAGVGIGNGLTDPITQVGTHASSAYFSGLINGKQKGELERAQREAIELAVAKNWRDATDARNRVLRLLHNMTGVATLYNYRRLRDYDSAPVGVLLNRADVKRVLGVNDTVKWEECSKSVKRALHEDVMKSAKYMVEYLVRNTRVLLYQGESDLRDGVVSSEAWIDGLDWDGIEAFRNAERSVWRSVNGDVCGYVQKWGGLSHAVVMGSGHFVPTDQPLNSRAMIENWVLEKGLFRKTD